MKCRSCNTEWQLGMIIKNTSIRTCPFCGERVEESDAGLDGDSDLEPAIYEEHLKFSNNILDSLRIYTERQSHRIKGVVKIVLFVLLVLCLLTITFEAFFPTKLEIAVSIFYFVISFVIFFFVIVLSHIEYFEDNCEFLALPDPDSDNIIDAIGNGLDAAGNLINSLHLSKSAVLRSVFVPASTFAINFLASYLVGWFSAPFYFCFFAWSVSGSLYALFSRAARTELYRKSAEEGNRLAQYYLGLAYEIGDGVIKNKSKAMEWYQKSAAQGCKKAEGALALLQKDN